MFLLDVLARYGHIHTYDAEKHTTNDCTLYPILPVSDVGEGTMPNLNKNINACETVRRRVRELDLIPENILWPSTSHSLKS